MEPGQLLWWSVHLVDTLTLTWMARFDKIKKFRLSNPRKNN